MRISPSEPCTDQEFIRRVSLDAIGVLPTPEEVARVPGRPVAPTAAPSSSTGCSTRPEFYDFWTLKFADILRSNARLIQAKGTHVFNRWIRTQLERNTPMDQFVRELLTADGSTFKNPAANYYRISRDPENSVETTAQLFLGVRIQCAKCHNHPFERWTQDDYYGFAAFFPRVQPEEGEPARRGGHLRRPRRRGPPAPDRAGDEAQGAGRPGARGRQGPRPPRPARRRG